MRELSPAISGLSPLTWGTRGAVLRLKLVRRFIPADVGNSFFVASSRIFSPVYPR
ncbi:hypothetical protein AC15_3089 [Escherichia coli 2-156-04_S3_C2]|nr:hypothetical protein AC15_3089 [Escherichia coli 2-156-04_S3_C2]